jgi:transposase
LGVKDRLVLSDTAWDRMAPLIIGRPDQKGSTGRDNRMLVEGVLWIVRTGSPWRDLPEAFGDWNSVFRRIGRWSIKGVWWRIFETMSDDPDFEYLIIDSTIVRAHQHAAGAKKGSEDQAIGRSRGGLSTKIHMHVRGLGCPVQFTLTAGHSRGKPARFKRAASFVRLSGGKRRYAIITGTSPLERQRHQRLAICRLPRANAY